MKIFYYCFAGVHSSVIAGYIHLNKLPVHRVPDLGEILAIAEFDHRQGRDFGIPYFLGADEDQNEIYLLGLGKNRALGLQTIIHLLEGNPDPTKWRFCSAIDKINLLTRVGGFLSRHLRFVSLGKILAAQGIRMNYYKLVELVTHEKEYGQNGVT